MSNLKFFKSVILSLGMFAGASHGAMALDGDAAAGEKVFKKCSACHQVGPDAKNAVGPVLNGVFGRTAGTFADYKYGKSIVAAGKAGLEWTEDEIFEYLANPKKYLRAKLDDKKAKSKMSFKLKKDEERANVIAYLKTFSPEAESESEGEGEGSSEETTSSD
ncbi:MAG: c-type cytochrome [Rhizobiaceae bacterium]